MAAAVCDAGRYRRGSADGGVKVSEIKSLEERRCNHNTAIAQPPSFPEIWVQNGDLCAHCYMASQVSIAMVSQLPIIWKFCFIFLLVILMHCSNVRITVCFQIIGN